MKNAISLKLAFMLAVVIGFAFTAKSVPATPELILTEVNADTLTYSWDGGATVTVSDISPDYWQFSIPNPNSPGDYATLIYPSYVGTVNINWQEPDYATSGLVNAVSIFQYQDNTNRVTVYSDASPTTFGTSYSPFTNGFVYSYATYDPQITGANSVQFNDDGDESVPDSGVTAFLLGMSLVALGFIGRKQFGISLV